MPAEMTQEQWLNIVITPTADMSATADDFNGPLYKLANKVRTELSACIAHLPAELRQDASGAANFNVCDIELAANENGLPLVIVSVHRHGISNPQWRDMLMEGAQGIVDGISDLVPGVRLTHLELYTHLNESLMQRARAALATRSKARANTRRNGQRMS